MLVSGLAVKVLLSGPRIKTLTTSLENRLPVPVSAGEGDFSLAQWFLPRPAITVERLSIGNPEGFSLQSLLQAREVSTCNWEETGKTGFPCVVRCRCK